MFFSLARPYILYHKMGQVPCCSSRSSTPQLSDSDLSTFSWTDSEPSRSQSMHNMTSCDHSQHERYNTYRVDKRVQDVKLSPPALKCFIIPSFGEDPPDNVAVKLKMSDKMASDFLKGVGEDFDIIQQLIKEDDNKQLYEVRLMCHFAQKKVKEFKKAIGDAMKSLKLKHTQKGCKYNKIYIHVRNRSYTYYNMCLSNYDSKLEHPFRISGSSSPEQDRFIR